MHIELARALEPVDCVEERAEEDLASHLPVSDDVEAGVELSLDQRLDDVVGGEVEVLQPATP